MRAFIHVDVFVIILTTSSLHGMMKLLCLILICKVDAYLVVLRKHSKSTQIQPKSGTLIIKRHAPMPKQDHLHLRGKYGRKHVLQCT